MVLIVAGAMIAVMGWLFLLGGVGVPAGQVVNMHLLAIANNVILLGYALVIAGLLLRFLSRSRAEPVTAPPLQPSPGPEIPEPEPRPLRFSPDQCQKLEAKFKEAFTKTVRVHRDGSAKLTNKFTSLQFASVEEAWKYCQARVEQKSS